MFRILILLIPFLKEHFFSRKEELDFRSKYFNPIKWWQYVSVIMLFMAMLFFGSKLFAITIKYARLRIVQQEQMKQLDAKNLENIKLQTKINILELQAAQNRCYIDHPDGSVLKPGVKSK